MAKNIFNEARRQAGALAIKPKKGAELPVIDIPAVTEAAVTFVRAGFMQALLGVVVDDAKNQLKDEACKLVVRDGYLLKSYPSNRRVVTPEGQVTLTLATRGKNRPVDPDTSVLLKKYNIPTTSVVTSPDTFSFNPQAMAIPVVQRRISALLSSDPELMQLLEAHAVSDPLVEFTPGFSSEIITDDSVVKLFESAADGQMVQVIPDDSQRQTELARLFGYMVDMKVESSAKPAKATALELGMEVMDIFNDVASEMSDASGSPID